MAKVTGVGGVFFKSTGGSAALAAPTLARCRRLRRVHIDKVAIRDLAPIAAAPAV
jgi:hypothetical protein